MMMFTRILGWTPPEVELFLVSLRKEIDDKSYHLLDHGYVSIRFPLMPSTLINTYDCFRYTVYGRKPLDAT